MPLHEILVEIVERASYLTERFSKDFIADKTQLDNELVDARIAQWCLIAAKGDQTNFTKRWTWANFDNTTIRAALGQVRLKPGQPLPTWAQALGTILEGASLISLETIKAKPPRFFKPAKPLPFEELLVPFIQFARHKLKTQVGERNYQLLSEEAHAALEVHLLTSLCRVSAASLMLEFEGFRSQRQVLRLFPDFAALNENPARELYKSFIENLLQGGLWEFFHQYSALGRLAAILTELWIETNTEFILRLAADWQSLATTFNTDNNLGQVITVKPGLSDEHAGGRTAFALKFSSGLSLVYKPRNVGLEVAFNHLLEWVNQQAGLLPLKVIKVINRQDYGWCEFVEQLPCENSEAVQRYYQRMGMLLALIYALDGTDCHYENIITCGEHPVLVDAETLMHPRVAANNVRTEEITPADLKNQLFLENSVLRTALLPFNLGEGSKSYEHGALNLLEEKEIPYRVPRWRNINTDEMRLSFEFARFSPPPNTAVLNGLQSDPADYITEVVTGFRQMYEFLLQKRKVLLAPASPLTTFASQPVRFVFRNTQVYGLLLNKLNQPRFMREGLDRSIELEALSRAYLIESEKPIFWAMLEVERTAMEQLDIPLFLTNSACRTLFASSGQPIENFFIEAGYTATITHLNELSEIELEQQISIIEQALAGLVVSV